MTVPRLSSFPISTGQLLISDVFDAWASNGWTEETVGDLGTPWGANGAYFVADLSSSPPVRSSELVKTYTVDDDADPLPANTLVAVRVGLTWNLGIGAPGGPGPVIEGLFFGAVANGIAGALPGPIFFDPVAREILILARTDGAGELELRVGATGLVGSFDIQAQFAYVRVGTLTGELADIFYDAGVLFVEEVAFSVTRGGNTFDPGEVWESYDFPGKAAPVEGLDELVSCTPTIRTRCMLTGEYQMMVYRPDAVWGYHESIESARTFTPADMRRVLSASKYLQNVIVVWARARGDYIAVHFPRAICRKWGLAGTDKDEGQIDVEFEARVPSGGSLLAPPYKIHTYAANTVTVG